MIVLAMIISFFGPQPDGFRIDRAWPRPAAGVGPAELIYKLSRERLDYRSSIGPGAEAPPQGRDHHRRSDEV